MGPALPAKNGEGSENQVKELVSVIEVFAVFLMRFARVLLIEKWSECEAGEADGISRIGRRRRGGGGILRRTRCHLVSPGSACHRA